MNTDEKDKVAVFLTAYNEASIIGPIVDKIVKLYPVFVIDDGSEDETAEICRKKGATVISHPINLGQASAGITMFEVINLLTYDYVVHLDADGQHNPDEIPKFISKLKETGADIAQGSRVLGSNYKGAPLSRRIFLVPLTWFLNRLTGYQMSDSMCGFQGYRAEVFKRLTYIIDDLSEGEYQAAEMWIKFAKAGVKMVDVPIALEARKKGTSYKGAIFKYGWGIISIIVHSLLDTYKYQYRNNKNNEH